MLPGFRFLFAAIVLSMSVLVFGLGAAALLRAAHEEFASTPSWRRGPGAEICPAERAPEEAPDEAMPVLAMLRVEPEPAQPTATDSIPAAAASAEPTGDRPGAGSAPKKSPRWSRRTNTPPEAAKPEIPVAETPVQGEAQRRQTRAAAD